ncbi:MAG: copper resistance protein CopC [Shinella sp.]|nr:copper resistance protein CopC [Shinella sp.]
MRPFLAEAARLLVAALILLAATGLFADQANAHANLISADPYDAAILAEPPARIVLRFSEAVAPLVARLIHPDGRTEILAAPTLEGSSLTYALAPRLSRGTYVLSWRVTSSDGHPVGGGQTFSVGAVSSTVPDADADAAPDGTVRYGLWASRFALMLSIVFGLGSTVFYALSGIAPDRRAGKVLVLLLFLGLAATPAVLAFQGLDALGEPVSAAGRADVWTAGLFATAYGRATLLAALAVVCAAIALAAGTASHKGWALIAFLIAASSFAAAGHAATAPPRFLTTPAVFLHALSLIAWLGAFIPLADVLARKDDDVARQVLGRFSKMIPPAILCLSASGFFLAAIQLERTSALWTTDYGYTLLAKLGLVTLLFLLAAVNRFFLTSPVLTGRVPARRRLRRSIQAEIALSVAVVAILGLWRFTPPPRALAAAAPSAITVISRSEGLEARLTLSPAQVGRAIVSADSFRLDGKDLAPLSVTVELSKPSTASVPLCARHRKLANDMPQTASCCRSTDIGWCASPCSSTTSGPSPSPTYSTSSRSHRQKILFLRRAGLRNNIPI